MMSALALVVLLGFSALGIEVGRWYAIQGEMSKAIDGAAFAGAKNINNPNITNTIGLEAFVNQVAQANFPPGLLGSNGATFTVANDGNGKITVNGSANSINLLARAYDTSLSQTPVAANGSAKLRNAEIALVLDVSGSMSGSPLSDLKDGATQFVENFADHEQTSKFAMITFASGVRNLFDLGHNYVSPVESAINSLIATGGTNTEDALAQTNNLPWSDQSVLPANERGKQVIILFSDGNPTAFRGQFKFNNQNYDAVAAVNTANNVYNWLSRPDQQNQTFITNAADRTGDGKSSGSTACPSWNGSKDNVKWYIFEDPTYGLNNFAATAGINPDQCYIGDPNPLFNYHEWVNKKMAIDHAQTLKNRGIEIYTIGLGNVDQTFLETVSSGPAFAYYTTNSSELAGIFQQIANILKLVLVS